MQIIQNYMMELLGLMKLLFQLEDLSTAAAGTTQAALLFGGFAPPRTAATEEWTGAGSPLTVTITAS
jgi:hypothetical protein